MGERMYYIFKIIFESDKALTREQVVECANRVTVDSVYLLKGEGKDNE